MVLAFKAVNGTAPVYLQTLVRPLGLVRTLRSTTSAGRLVPPSQRANKAHFSLFWHLSGGTISRPMSGHRNHSPSSSKDSRLSCWDFTPTLHSMTPPPKKYQSIFDRELLRTSDVSLTIVSIFLFTLSTVISFGFSPATYVFALLVALDKSVC